MRKLVVFLGCFVAAVSISYLVGTRVGATRADKAGVAVPLRSEGQRQQPPAPSQAGGQVMRTNLFRDIARQENPMVVFITTESRATNPEGEDLLQRFFGIPGQSQPQVQRALGSGFIISRDGEILTNNHVIQGAQQIKVGLFENNRQTYDAHVVGADPLSDSALIKLDNPPANLPIVTLGDSSQMEPGDWVMAIGNPFQLGHTVTVGVISYKGRPFTVGAGRSEDMLQTDAAINPGNSGGPLINVEGQVIGINSAILSGTDTGGNIGIGFAVPINTVKELLPQLRRGKVVRGRLGVQVRTAPITDDEAKALGLPRPEGALVSLVERDSPASRAGIRPGDVIVSYNGKGIPDADALVKLVSATTPGTAVPIGIYRDGRPMTLSVTIAELNAAQETGSGGEQGSVEGYGLTLQTLTPDIARQLRVPSDMKGAVVSQVDPGGAAAQSGMEPGDVITQVNRRDVTSASEASKLLHDVPSGQTAFVLVWRDGNEMLISVRR